MIALEIVDSNCYNKLFIYVSTDIYSNHSQRVAAKLLASSSEELRIDALKIISKVLHQSNTK